MKRPLLSGGMNPLAVAGLAAALLLLAGLQYRWIGEMAEADRERLRRGAEAAAELFRDDFNRELRRLALSFDIGAKAMQDGEWQRFVDRLADWRAISGGYIEIEDLFVREPPRDGSGLVWRLAPDGMTLEPGEAPAGLAADLERWSARGQYRGGGFRGAGGLGRPGASFLTQGPSLIFGLFGFDRGAAGQGPRRPVYLGTLGLVLSRESITQSYLPELVERYFGGHERSLYAIAVLEDNGRDGEEIVYSSQAGLDAGSFRSPQVRIPLLWRREEDQQLGRARGRVLRGGPDRFNGPSPEAGGLTELLFEAIAPGGPGEWMLAVQPAGGSIDAVVGRLRRRNLAISLGILALLAAGMAVLLVSSRRAERLARLQMEFVAGVSHELRTPLAVIRSAGDNLAEGVVKTPQQVADYGKLIRDEGRRLTGMVEQTLQFASTQAGRQVYKLESVPAGDLVRRAVDDLRPAVEEAGFTLEQDFEDDLPDVLVDSAAASRVLQSLVENALKYGGEQKWVSIQAARRDGGVEVTVRDRGVGIDPEDLPHIFEPFYRGKKAMDAQIHGTGLGLSLAKSAAEGFGGGLRVESSAGQGAAFTLTIPMGKKG